MGVFFRAGAAAPRCGTATVANGSQPGTGTAGALEASGNDFSQPFGIRRIEPAVKPAAAGSERGNPVDFMPPSITDIVGGVLSLAARDRISVSRASIHSILCEMKGHEPILAALHFSITGAVHYSRKVDDAIDALAERGFLAKGDDSTVVIERIPHIRTRFLTTLTYSQFHALESASRRFHERLLAGAAPLPNSALG